MSAQQLESVLGGDLLGQLAGQLGLSPQAAGEQLAQLLPQAVDQLTPEGRLPDQDPLAGGLGDIGAILGRFGGR
ncbi:YidB family protein [Piscinibacter sakaiensis]|uniref:YidB family protein n=1 Tax=Piscinibacter sakaiensis TaxID=1547922 RepID=UPI00372B5757